MLVPVNEGTLETSLTSKTSQLLQLSSPAQVLAPPSEGHSSDWLYVTMTTKQTLTASVNSNIQIFILKG